MSPVLRIFVSSPGDVGRERALTQRVIERCENRFGGRVQLEGYFWEHEPMRTTRGDFQTQISAPAEFDLVICILWSRLGSRLHPGIHQREDGTAYASGTEYEFEDAARAFRAQGKPDLLVYRRKETPLFPPDPPDDLRRRLDQWEALKAFCDRWFKDESVGSFKAAYNSYQDLAEFETKLEQHLDSVVREWLGRHGLIGAAAASKPATWLQGSPYRGLQVFDFEHEPVFFGRTKARDDVLGALRARSVEEQCPFVLVFGASGSGKSSLLRAGVLPWLVRPGVIEGVGLWRWLVWRPAEGQGDALAGLARALVGPGALPELLADGTTLDELARLLREEPKLAAGLVRGALAQAALRAQSDEQLARQPPARLAIGLDQLEEVFTLAERFTAENRRALFCALAALVRHGGVWAVATLRSDFYSRCEEIPELVELKRGKGQYHLLPPSGPELSQMIRYPAEAAGVVFEDHAAKGKLDDVIRDAALAQTGALPLLEYALDELFRNAAQGGVLLHEAYEALGGVEGAVARRAQETFDALSRPAQAAFDQVLRGLITLGEGDEEVPTRKVLCLEEAALGAEAAEVVEAFATARLLTRDRDTQGRRTVTVAHEALLRCWPRVVEWVAGNRDYLRMRVRLERALALWQENDEHDDYLLVQGRPLAEAEDLLAKHDSALGVREQEFIRASRAKVDAAERRLVRIRRWVTIGLAGLALGAGVAAVVALKARNAASLAEKLRETERDQARRDASDADLRVAVQLWERGEPTRALPFLARSIRNNPANTGAVALGCNLLAMTPHPLREFPDSRAIDWEGFQRSGTIAVWDRQGEPERPWESPFLGFSPDGSKVVIPDEAGSAQVFETATRKPVGVPLRHEKAIVWTRFSPDGARIVTASGDKTARLWDAQTGLPLSEPLQHDEYVFWAYFNASGTILATCCERSIRLWDGVKGKPLGEPIPSQNFSMAPFDPFSPDGTKLVLIVNGQDVQVWDLATEKLALPVLHHESTRVIFASFSPDGRRLLTSPTGEGGRAIGLVTWDAQTGKNLATFRRHLWPASSAAFDRTGSKVVSATMDGTARIWDAQSGVELAVMQTRADAFDRAVFNPAGDQVLVEGPSATAQLWSASSTTMQGRALRHADEISSICVSPDGSAILTGSDDQTTRLWDAQTGLPRGEPLLSDTALAKAAFAADDSKVATVAFDKTCCIWDARAGRRLAGNMQNASESSADSTVVAFRPDGAALLLQSGPKTLQLRDAESGVVIGADLTHATVVRAAVFDAAGSKILTWDADSIRLWDGRSGSPLNGPFKVGELDILSSPVMSPDGSRVLAELNAPEMSGEVYVWKTATGERLFGPLSDGDHLVHKASMSPDGNTLVAIGQRSVQVFDGLTGQPLGVPLLSTSTFNTAAYSPDSTKVIASSDDNTATIFDARTGLPLAEPLKHSFGVRDASFSPDGTQVVTWSYDKRGRVWDARTGQPVMEFVPHRGGYLDSIHFCAEGTTLLTHHEKSCAALWSVPPGKGSSEPLQLLVKALEASAGERLSAEGIPVKLSWAERTAVAAEVAGLAATDRVATWIRWVYSPADTRPISPFLGEKLAAPPR